MLFLVILSAVYLSLSRDSVSGRLEIILTRDALESLGVKSYTVGNAVLIIPGVGAFTPDTISSGVNGLKIVFNRYYKYENYIVNEYINNNMSAYPSVYILLDDYNTHRAYGILISSRSLNIVKLIINKHIIDYNDLLRLSSNNKLSLLTERKIVINSEYASILLNLII